MCSIPTTYPPAWARFPSELSGPVTLDVAGYATRIERTPEQLERTYLPVLALLVRQHAERCGQRLREDRRPVHPSECGPPARLLAGLAGIPGGGKSTFTAALAHIAGHVVGPDRFVAIGMDGWHLPNAILDRRCTADEHGQRIPLRRRKGGPQSFDVSAMTAALRQLRETRRPVRLPVYDRRLHDPVPDGLAVGPAADIVLIEGNYLLCENPPWNDVAALLDVKLYLESDPALARERMIARHIRGGCPEAEAVRKYRENDTPNTRFVQSSAGRADYIVRP